MADVDVSELNDLANDLEDSGKATMKTIRSVVHKGAANVRRDARSLVSVLDHSSLLDPDLVDQEFKVVAGHAKTFATARRLQVERVTT